MQKYNSQLGIKKSRKKPLTKTFEEILVKYQDLFDFTVNAALYAYRDEPLPDGYPRWAHILHYQIVAGDLSSALSKEDIEQELLIIWWNAFETYKRTRPDVKLKRYLIRMGCFILRPIIERQVRVPTHEKEALELNVIEWQSDFKLDLKFVINGSEEQPWCILTPYERYLLYVHFTCNVSLFEIARMLRRDIDTMQKHMKCILKRLKEP